jgi:hypothetical protein
MRRVVSTNPVLCRLRRPPACSDALSPPKTAAFQLGFRNVCTRRPAPCTLHGIRETKSVTSNCKTVLDFPGGFSCHIIRVAGYPYDAALQVKLPSRRTVSPNLPRCSIRCMSGMPPVKRKTTHLGTLRTRPSKLRVLIETVKDAHRAPP